MPVVKNCRTIFSTAFWQAFRWCREIIKRFLFKLRLKTRSKYWTDFAKENTDNKKLSPEKREMIVDFYRPFFKIKEKSINFHKYYYEKNGSFSPKYIPEDIFFCYIDPYFNNWDEAKYLDNKCYYSQLFSMVKQPKTIVMRSNNLWFNENTELISQESAIEEVLNAPSAFVKKATSSDGGSGVHYIEYGQGTKSFVDLLDEIDGDLIVQMPVEQHETLSKLNPSSVNTIRVISLLSEKGTKIYSGIVRMGIDGSKVDNASSGGISCGIDDDGIMREFAYTEIGVRFEEHPNSKVRFLGYKLPSYKEIKEIVCRVHPLFPHFRLISWDFAIDKEGNPVLIEANLCYGGVNFHQVNNGPIFGDDTERILSEVFLRNK